MKEVQEQLVINNQKLITIVIKNMNLLSQYDDLKDIALIGLVKGAKYFDEKKGYKASTFLSRCIQNEILIYLRKFNVKRGKGSTTVSLENTVCENITYEDLLYDKNAFVEDEILKKEQLEQLMIAIEKLNDREKTIIFHSYGLGSYEQLTQQELSKKIGVSQSYISRVRSSALKKIRKELVQYI